MTAQRRRELESLVWRLRREVFATEDAARLERLGAVLRSVRERLEAVEGPERAERDRKLNAEHAARQAFVTEALSTVLPPGDEQEQHDQLFHACGGMRRFEQLRRIFERVEDEACDRSNRDRIFLRFAHRARLEGFSARAVGLVVALSHNTRGR